MTFGEKLYRLRKDRDMSQETLAAELALRREGGRQFPGAGSAGPAGLCLCVWPSVCTGVGAGPVGDLPGAAGRHRLPGEKHQDFTAPLRPALGEEIAFFHTNTGGPAIRGAACLFSSAVFAARRRSLDRGQAVLLQGPPDALQAGRAGLAQGQPQRPHIPAQKIQRRLHRDGVHVTEHGVAELLQLQL